MNEKIIQLGHKIMFSLVMFLCLYSLTFLFCCMLLLFFLSLLFARSALAFSNDAVRVSCKSGRAQASSLVLQLLIDSSSSANQSKRGGVAHTGLKRKIKVAQQINQQMWPWKICIAKSLLFLCFIQPIFRNSLFYQQN